METLLSTKTEIQNGHRTQMMDSVQVLLMFIVLSLHLTPIFPSTMTTRIGQKNRTSYLVFQRDGNLVLYRQNHNPVWASGTNGRGKRAIFQEDGNVVVYDDYSAVWASNTNGHPDSQLCLQNDGNLVIYDDGKPIWASNTNDGWCASVPNQ